jgi:hypothetical protein
LSVLARYAQGSWRSRRKRELHRDAAKQAHSHAKLLVIRPFPLHLRTGRSGPLIRRRIGLFFFSNTQNWGAFRWLLFSSPPERRSTHSAATSPARPQAVSSSATVETAQPLVARRTPVVQEQPALLVPNGYSSGRATARWSYARQIRFPLGMQQSSKQQPSRGPCASFAPPRTMHPEHGNTSAAA